MINFFVEQVQKNGLNVNSIMITQDDKTSEFFFNSDTPCSLRSISKVISCLGVHLAMKSGMFDLDTLVMSFFKDIKITNEKNIEPLNHLKIRHLLNLTIGHEYALMFSKDLAKLPTETNLLEYVLNYDIRHLPGEYFVYNNAATYILSAIIQRQTGMNFSEWIKNKIFNPLNITKFKWENSPQGICLGASGLFLCNKDLHKIAKLLLRKGMTENGNQLIEESWVEDISTPKVLTANLPEYINKQDRSLNKMAYGYHLWICGDGSATYPKTHYFVDGTDGQFLIMVPPKNMTITILSNQKDMNPLYPLFDEFVM